ANPPWRSPRRGDAAATRIGTPTKGERARVSRRVVHPPNRGEYPRAIIANRFRKAVRLVVQAPRNSRPWNPPRTGTRKESPLQKRGMRREDDHDRSAAAFAP